ncbi:hypothetical protein D9758_002330 [Tetrapyrgos nigripes]|uniref:RRM domain-containing protein n=1 Tax=Tetrapyrgos nigripes TaxID=182062 RepID=A0A8H5LSN9_9AGAR|nr:hypothetical protein D9758_002330 [Tetrapyrgos nigripes]
MPFKSPRSRTWGTRFDSLHPSPPPSPKATEPGTDSTVADVVQLPVKASAVKKDSQDASIFVGSLPVNIEPNELLVSLSDHLSDYKEIKSIKVHRDLKGGVCAFIQCEDAAAAGILLNTFHSNPPNPFCNRNLRFEVARAPRSLIISYCIPTSTMTKEIATENDVDGTANATTTITTVVELNLPYAMRIWKNKNTNRQVAGPQFLVSYDFEGGARQNKVNPPELNHILQFDPLRFDDETLKLICTHFGPVEYFRPYNSGDIFPPHNAPRKPNMDTRCFEIKWRYRDDCVSAFTTIRKEVLHLNVSWLHRHDRLALQAGLPAVNPRRHHFVGAYNHSRAQSINESSFTMDRNVMHSTGDPRGDRFGSGRANWLELDFPPLGNAKKVWDEEPSQLKLDQFDGTSGSSPVDDIVPGSRGDVSSNVPASLYREVQSDDTPILGMSPLTPKTSASASGFPTTPTSSNGDCKSSAFLRAFEVDDSTSVDDLISEGNRVLDPTSLFVGGLEMYGPNAWDEPRLLKFFGRFVGLKNVRLIRPPGGRTAFAFIKYDNKESPARAICEENNNVYEGRILRVQLRDYNAPRGNFKAARGRGRYFSGPPTIQPCNDFSFDEARVAVEAENPVVNDVPPSSVEEVEPMVNNQEVVTPLPTPSLPEIDPVEHPEPVSEQPSYPASESAHSEPTLVNKEIETFREWYETGVPSSATCTPPPAGPVMPPAHPMGAYPVPPPPGYYPGAPWMPQYPPMQYPMPYMLGYPPMYQIPNGVCAAPYTSSNGSDASGPIAGPPLPPPPQNPWPGMYGVGVPLYLFPGSSLIEHVQAYIPYPAYPARPSPAERSSPQPLPGQAPVTPEGLFQVDQGPLIPVYQPESLQRYMQDNQIPMQSLPTSVPVQIPPQHMQGWTPIPQQPQPQPAGIQQVLRPVLPPNFQFQVPAPNPGIAAGGNWMPPNPVSQTVPFLPPQSVPTSTNIGHGNLAGGPNGPGNFPRRQGGRKDHQFNGNRHPRRNGRGGVGDGRQNFGGPAMAHVGNPEWNHLHGRR